MTTHLARLLGQILAERDIKNRALARQLGCSAPTITRLLKGGRADETTLRALCTTWETPETGLLLLRAHLYDEVERCGRSLRELQIDLRESLAPADRATEQHLRQLDGDLALIERHLRDGDVRTMVHYIADVLRADEPAKQVAEDPPDYPQTD